jgi:hypothetical protein
LALGYARPDDLLAVLSARELNEWQAFYDVEPWGSQHDFYCAGIPAAAIINMHRDPKKSKPVSPLDFIPRLENVPRSRVSKPEDPKVTAARFALIFAGRIVPKNENDVRHQGRKGDGKSP